MVFSQIGQHQNVAGRDVVAAQTGEAGYLLYGPYVRVKPGAYVVEFVLEGEAARSPGDTGIKLDVVADRGQRFIQERAVLASDLKGGRASLAVNFAVDEEATVEFRVFSHGLCDLVVDVDRPLSAVSADGAVLPYAYPVADGVKDLYDSHYRVFRSLKQRGAKISLGSADVTVAFHGLTFHLVNAEDMQVVEEVFMLNTYAIASPRDKIVVDIGMNSGLTSLFLANMPTVREVHAFEPFALPYERAMRNFALNPGQAGRIKPQQVGLGSKDERRDVLVDPGTTIGTSINGLGVGRPETIELRNAAAVIGPLADRAEAAGLDLIVKMDCEGSEFGIFEALEGACLFGRITALAIEWHKWWSADKTQADLIRPLLAAGFVVLDQTHPDNPHAGMLYAVRAAR